MYDMDLIRKFINKLPLCEALGIYVLEYNAPVFALPYSNKIIGDPKTGIVHGGAISTLLDTACGAITITHPEGNFNTATIDLRIDYMRPARPKLDILARADIYQITRHIAFLRGLAWDETEDKPVAMATGTFTFAKKVQS